MPNLLVTALNAGELSPYMDARTDVEKYSSGCRTLENMIVLPYGGVYRRAGTEYLGEAKNANQRCRLIGFNFSVTTRFVLEFGHQYIRFWGNDSIVSHPAASAWATATAYKLGDFVTNSGTTYICVEAHTASAAFSTDAAKWYAQPVSGVLEIPSPYLEAQLREIQYVQVNDIMYLAHGSHAPRKIKRLADNQWTIEAVNWKYPPLLDQNITDIQIATTAELGVVTLTGYDASKNLNNNTFQAGHVGSKWAIQWPRNSAAIDIPISANGMTQKVLDIQGTWTLTTVGTWQADLRIYRIPRKQMDKNGGGIRNVTSLTRSTTTGFVTIPNHAIGFGESFLITGAGAPFDGLFFPTAINGDTIQITVANSGLSVGNAGDTVIYELNKMEVVREFISETTARNIIATGTEDERVGLLLRVSNYISNTNGRAILESTDFNSGGTFVVNSIGTNGRTCTATVDKWFGTIEKNTSPNALTPLKTTAEWSEAAFSEVRGYPRAVCLHEQRLCFGGTSFQPNTVWCSKVDEFEDFQLGAKADDGLSFSIASSEGNRIAWMFSQQKLMIGTSGDEWTMTGADSTAALSSTNVQTSKQSAFGSKSIRAIQLNDVLLFVQRNGRKIREFTYNFEKDGWVAPDLTVLAEHISQSEIAEIAFQQQPDAILWGVRGDGQLIGMSYERDQNVVAWHRHTTDGEFESVATVYGLSGADDEVWFVVKRTINGTTKRYIERFKADARAKFEAQTKEDWWYLDCAKRYSGTAAATITGLSHLEGKSVGVLANGAVQPNKTVSSGQIVLDKAFIKVLAGLPFTSTVQPMKLEYDLQDGPTRGRKKKINRVQVGLYKSLGGEVSTDGTEWLWIYPRDFDDPMDASPPPFSGDSEVVVSGDYSDDSDLRIRQILPYPLTIRCLVAKLDAFGD